MKSISNYYQEEVERLTSYNHCLESIKKYCDLIGISIEGLEGKTNNKENLESIKSNINSIKLNIKNI